MEDEYFLASPDNPRFEAVAGPALSGLMKNHTI